MKFRTLNETFSEKEMKYLKKLKGERTWREAIILWADFYSVDLMKHEQ